MKLSLFLAFTALATPTLAQNTEPAYAPVPVPVPDAKFDWKLRLTKGQTWIQTTNSRTQSIQELPAALGKPKTRLQLDIRQNIVSKNEVLDVTPTFYLIRTTYTRFDVSTSINGKTQKALPSPASDFAGLSFSIKQTQSGRVLDVTGLEEFIARQTKMLNSLGKTPSERAALRDFLPSTAKFKQSIIQSQSLAFPKAPLALGESYSYGVSLPMMADLKVALNGKRTLRSFDGNRAIFDEDTQFSTPPTQIMGSTEKMVTLSDSAAMLYMARNRRAEAKSFQVYLSKNGRIYYRNPQNPINVVWLDPPAQGIKIKESESIPYQDVQGFNGQSTGKGIDYFFSVASGSGKPNLTPPAIKPSPTAKAFMTMTGTITGQSTVEVASGLPLQSQVTTSIKGKVTIVTPQGQKITTPLLVTGESTTVTRQ